MGPSQICGCPFREPRGFEIAHIYRHVLLYYIPSKGQVGFASESSWGNFSAFRKRSQTSSAGSSTCGVCCQSGGMAALWRPERWPTYG